MSSAKTLCHLNSLTAYQGRVAMQPFSGSLLPVSQMEEVNETNMVQRRETEKNTLELGAAQNA